MVHAASSIYLHSVCHQLHTMITPDLEEKEMSLFISLFICSSVITCECVNELFYIFNKLGSTYKWSLLSPYQIVCITCSILFYKNTISYKGIVNISLKFEGKNSGISFRILHKKMLLLKI